MQIALVGSAAMLSVFGLILFFRPDIEKRISDWLNRNLLLVEDMMRSSNRIGGLLLIALGIVVYILATKK
ncbi:MAG: hypothetical protein Q8R14_03210 [Candidatus Omnitrophota bacterium]|nr:hypothetical protein [Candidatus Omnitrophota bacterium]